MKGRIWPSSLTGQLLLAVALALLLAQAIGAVLVYRAQSGLREAGMVHQVAMRLIGAARSESDPLRPMHHGRGGRWVERSAQSPEKQGEARDFQAEAQLREIMTAQDVSISGLVVVRRDVAGDPEATARFAQRASSRRWRDRPAPETELVAGVRLPGNEGWLVARSFEPPGRQGLLFSLIGQTLFIYIVLVGAIAFFMRRITRPLAALTTRMEQFAATRDPDGQLPPDGPEDVGRLIAAHNAMEDRIAALLDEKDVMLGAIGHDLKTPLAALRVRIESVENDTERTRLAATIEDMNRSLDDILSLARAGRARDPLENTELLALAASVVEEYEDLEEPVTLGEAERIVLPIRATWLRRAIRNLVGNALRYGKVARVSLARQGAEVVIRVDDDGPGIPEGDISRMLEPFTRGEPSRNSATGGAGLGLALARAIAEQHGGKLVLANRRGADGEIAGLTAELRLPSA
ncbi:MAG: ATP-binding protein [Novosphingobium sp.]